MSPLKHINLGLINFVRMIYFGNAEQLLLFSVAMTNALAALFSMRTVYTYIHLYVLCFMFMAIAISLDRWNVKINYNYNYNYNI
jgi:hypothetical protein